MRLLPLLLVLLIATPVWSGPRDGIILMGPPGSGKGTQGNFLRERHRLKSISPGDLLRAEVQAGTQLGKKAQGFMNTGQLVPDPLILQLVAGQLDRLDEDQGFLFDGFPRTKVQAELLDQLLEERRLKIASVVLFKMEDQSLVLRLSGRRVCPTCQRSYHVRDNPPQKDGVCDEDSSALTHRPDDRPEVIAKRLEAYHRSTLPLAEYYQKRGLLHALNADQPIEVLKTQVLQVVEPALRDPALSEP